MSKPAPYDNGKIKIGLLWTPPPPPVDFDMEAIQQVICPPSKRLVKTSVDEWFFEVVEGFAIIALILLFLVLCLYPQTIHQTFCN